MRLDRDIDTMILIHDNARSLKVLTASSEYSFCGAVSREREVNISTNYYQNKVWSEVSHISYFTFHVCILAVHLMLFEKLLCYIENFRTALLVPSSFTHGRSDKIFLRERERV